MTKTKTFNAGDIVKVDGFHAIYAGKRGEHVVIPLKGQGWPLSKSEMTIVDGLDLAALNGHPITGWYVELQDCTLVTAIVKEPTAPMAKAVLDLLRRKGAITSLEAQGVLRCRQLPARVLDLKRLGHKIVTELKVDPTGQKYARYHLQAVA